MRLHIYCSSSHCCWVLLNLFHLLSILLLSYLRCFLSLPAAGSSFVYIMHQPVPLQLSLAIEYYTVQHDRRNARRRPGGNCIISFQAVVEATYA